MSERRITKPDGENKIPAWQLAYMGARANSKIRDVLLRELKASGVTPQTIAARLGWPLDDVELRLFSTTHLTVRQVGELLFAMGGRELDCGARDCPFDPHPATRSGGEITKGD